MARIKGVPQDHAGPMVKLVYWFMRRGMKKLTGASPPTAAGSNRSRSGPTSRR